MQEHEILDIYQKLYDYTLQIKAAIEEKKWEHVSLLASKREELFQITNAFMLNKDKPVEPELKAKIKLKIDEIIVVDNENFKQITQDKKELEKLKAKVVIGHRALNVYHGKTNEVRSTFDTST
ncbi:MAG: hypothetical protein AB7V50_00450 [Vampirovibrionia bacterium]